MLFNKNFVYPWKRNAPWKHRSYFWIIVILISSLYFTFCDLPNPQKHITICVFKNITGYPCGACGTTRALKYLFHLDFYNALIMNPLAYLVTIGALISFVWLLVDVLRNRSTFFSFFNRDIHWSLVVLIIIFVAANWYWNIKKGM